MKKSILKVNNESIVIYESAGAGPTALMLHGNSCSSEYFFPILDGEPGQRFHLVSIDLPGHGQSEPATDPATVYGGFSYISIVTKISEQLGVPDAVLIGHSLGGHIMLEASEELPETRGLFLIGTPPLGLPPAMEEAFVPNLFMFDIPFKADLTESDIELWASHIVRKGSSHIKFYCDTIRKTDSKARAYLGESLTSGKFKDEIQIISNMACPVAIIQGEDEQLVNNNYFNRLSIPALWGNKVQIIPNAGHSPHLEQPELFNKILIDFLEDTA